MRQGANIAVLNFNGHSAENIAAHTNGTGSAGILSILDMTGLTEATRQILSYVPEKNKGFTEG